MSGYIRTLDKDLAVFADELLAQAREAEAVALAAQAQRYEAGPPGGGVRVLTLALRLRFCSHWPRRAQHMGGAAAYGAPHAHPHHAAAQQQQQQAAHAYGARRGGTYPPDVGEQHAPPQQAPPPPAQPQYRPPRAGDNAAHWCVRSLRALFHAESLFTQPPCAHNPRQQRRRQLVPNDQVAANTADSGENWIITTFMGISQAGGLYDLKDEEAEPNTTNRYFLEAHNVLPLPRSASVREERSLALGTPVLGVYPGTTTFYRATILAPPRRLPTGEYEAYLLQFEDDEVEGGGLGRPVDFRHVVALPQ